MIACWCSLAGTAACRSCSNNPYADFPVRTNTVTVTDGTFYTQSLPSAQPEQRWIPVTEMLPEKESVYIVTFASGAVGLSSMDESYGVIAWRELPEPYRGEQDGQ